MIKIEKLLVHKEKELRVLIQKLKESIENAPTGSLRISNNKHGVYYYHCMAEQDALSSKCKSRKHIKNNGVYIKKDNINLAKALAQKSYNMQVLVWAKKCHKQLVTFLQTYNEQGIGEIYDKMSIERKKLLQVIAPSVQDMVRMWMETPYEGKQFYNEDLFFLTENGERVRSKSEKILADKFLIKGIPYKYECPLRLDGYGLIYPDFTLMNVNDGRIFYWEHFGMMDDEEYVRKAIRKIESYEKNGIFQGKQLIITFETKKSGFNTAIVEMILQEYFS